MENSLSFDILYQNNLLMNKIIIITRHICKIILFKGSWISYNIYDQDLMKNITAMSYT